MEVNLIPKSTDSIQIPDYLESGYTDGVWLTNYELNLQSPTIDYISGTRYFLMFTSTKIDSGEHLFGDRKTLVGVELSLGKSLIGDGWGIKINKYVNLGTVSGNSDWKRMNKKGDFEKIYTLYGEHFVKFVRFAPTFEMLAPKILKTTNLFFPELEITQESAEVVRYFRPISIPELENMSYSSGIWMDEEAFDINVIQVLPKTSDDSRKVYIFSCNNLIKSPASDVIGIFSVLYREVVYNNKYNEKDWYPVTSELRFLGFLPDDSISTYSITAFLEDNFVLELDSLDHMEEYNDIPYFWCGEQENLFQLQDSIMDTIENPDDFWPVIEMDIFK